MWTNLVNFFRHCVTEELEFSHKQLPTLASTVSNCSEQIFSGLQLWELSESDFRLIIGGEGVSGKQAFQLFGSLTPPRLHEVLNARAGIVLLGVHRITPLISEAKSTLAINTGESVHANAYLAPPRSKGANRHKDDHHVLIVQLRGRKNWTIFAKSGSKKITLEEGDVLFLQKGVAHCTNTTNSSSLHITFGVGSSRNLILGNVRLLPLIPGIPVTFMNAFQLLEIGATAQIQVLYDGDECVEILSKHALDADLRVPVLLGVLSKLRRGEIEAALEADVFSNKARFTAKRLLIASGCALLTHSS